MESKDKRKRKQVTLSIEQKIEVLEKLDRGISNTAIASEYGIGKSTVTDIQKSRSKITQFAAEAKDSSSFKKRCIVRRADDQFDEAMHLWFTQASDLRTFHNYEHPISRGVRIFEVLLYRLIPLRFSVPTLCGAYKSRFGNTRMIT